MSQIEGLKVFISERLHAATSEIIGAVVKTMSDYEEQVSRLKEENERHRSLLDIIIKSKLSEGGASQTNTKPHSSSSAAAVLRPSGSNSQPSRASSNTSRESKGLFTSCEDFLKSQDDNGNCPYCIKRYEATETHLMRRHYLRAIHFIQEGTEKFVIPCMCKERIQGRSHWHCPCCQKIIYRTCNFEAHLSKIHGYVMQQQSQDAGTSHPSEIEDEALHSPELWNENEQQRSLMLQVKQETEQVTLSDGRHFEDMHVSGEANYAQEPTTSIVCMDSFIQDISQIQTVHIGRRRTQPDSSRLTEPTPRFSAAAENGSSSKTEELKKEKPGSNVKTLNSRSKKCVKRSLRSLAVQKSTENYTGPHCCKACGKVFHYFYTLKAHVQTHTLDRKQICGICGKRLKMTERLIEHLQSHTKRNRCSKCGKQFSSSFRLKRHMKFHQPKVLNVTSWTK